MLLPLGLCRSSYQLTVW